MTEKNNEFREWMDQRGLKTKDVAAALHVEEQTIRIWRSQGVPPRRLPHVQSFMETWKPAVDLPSPEEIETLKGHSITIFPSREKFNRWSEAFKNSTAKNMEEWAETGLDQIAEEWETTRGKPNLTLLKVADDAAEYKAK